ncbi:hypothetical protein V6R21_28635 [Limibacter armeniacum]|uniref:hypothetical protein n=1 Tax=Limibacter armeniacum TaxID=466084 RepID=UPI002FE5E409
MLTDHWVIAQLLSQLCATILLFGASIYAVMIIKNWDASSGSEKQLHLERRTYLVSSIVQFVLIFQLVTLVTFLVTANNHLPSVIKGAMCAQGALDVNEYGYPVLYIKTVSVFLYIAYLAVNYLDDAEPGYPLTPLKYWLVLPALLLVSTDLVFMLMYFASIEPDVIATCCSVAFLSLSNSESFQLVTPQNVSFAIAVFVSSFVLLQLTIWFLGRQPWLSLVMACIFSASGIISLKYFFVKYIYGLPSHLCLFDIFLSQYYGIGYIIFGAYFIMGASVLIKCINYYAKGKLQVAHAQLNRQLNIVASIAGFIAFCIPLLYWLLWNGQL